MQNSQRVINSYVYLLFPSKKRILRKSMGVCDCYPYPNAFVKPSIPTSLLVRQESSYRRNTSLYSTEINIIKNGQSVSLADPGFPVGVADPLSGGVGEAPTSDPPMCKCNNVMMSAIFRNFNPE